jgi:hypothetical protein
VSTTVKVDTHAPRRTRGVVALGRVRGVAAPMVAAAIVAPIFVARLVAAFQIKTPVYFPDEYFYTALSRSLWSGSFPSVRGEHVQFVSLLAPLIFAPAWLVENVHVAYRIAQTEGVLATTLAALPAYILAARLGLGDRARVAAAVFAVLVPDAVYGGFMLSEPFAYPLFLTTVLLAVEALAAPRTRKQAMFLAACGLLVFCRTQFIVLPIAYLIAGWACSGRLSPRRAVREQWLVVAIVAIGGVLVAAISHGSLGIYGGITGFELTPGDVLHWVAVNAALLALASGWVIVPAAIVGLPSLMRSRHARRRAFGMLLVPVVVVLLLQAAIFGAGQGQLMERYTFYAAPLLALACLAAMRDGLMERRAHRALLAAFAGLAILLPVDDHLLVARDDFAPVLVALRPARDFLGSAFPLVVAIPLVVLTLAALIFVRYGKPFAVALIGLAICAAASASASVVIRPGDQGGVRQLAISKPATFVTSSSTNPSTVMTTLFWNPPIQRVLATDGGRPDGYAVAAAEIGRGGVVRANGKRIPGALVFDAASTVVRVRRARVRSEAGVLVVGNAPDSRITFLAEGWSRRSRYLAASGRFIVAAPAPDAPLHTRLVLRLQSDRERPKTVLRFASSSGLLRRVTIGERPTVVSLPVTGRGVWSCKFGLVRGQLSVVDGQSVSVRALSIGPTPPG